MHFEIYIVFTLALNEEIIFIEQNLSWSFIIISTDLNHDFIKLIQCLQILTYQHVRYKSF